MDRRAYPTDLTDAQWSLLEPLLPPDSYRGHPRTVRLREVVIGVLYVLRGGIPWRMMPHDLPPWGTVWWYFRKWRTDGTWERVEEALRPMVRESEGRGQAGTGQTAGTLPSSPDNLGRRSLCRAPGDMGQGHPRVVVASGAAEPGQPPVRSNAPQMGGGAYAGLAQPLPTAQQGLRGTAGNRRDWVHIAMVHLMLKRLKSNL